MSDSLPHAASAPDPAASGRMDADPAFGARPGMDGREATKAFASGLEADDILFDERLYLPAPLRWLLRIMMIVMFAVGAWLASSLWPRNPTDALLAFTFGAVLPLFILRSLLAPFRIFVEGRSLRWAWNAVLRGRVDLSSITDVDVIEVRAMRDFMGWGVQLMPHATGIIVRSGPAIRIHRVGRRRTLVITTDRPDELRAVLLAGSDSAAATGPRQGAGAS